MCKGIINYMGGKNTITYDLLKFAIWNKIKIKKNVEGKHTREYRSLIDKIRFFYIIL